MEFSKLIDHGFYWLIRRPINKIIELAYLKIPLAFCKRENVKNEKVTIGIVDIIVISYNNERIINIQIDKLRKYFKDAFCLTIADNSTDKLKAIQIQEICIEKNIRYIKLPRQNYFKGSASHGIALNWVYKNYIKKRQPEYFGFLDHDLFPVANISVRAILEKQWYFGLRHYGINAKNKNVWDANTPIFWYLWAGLCFFKTSCLQNKKVNFMHCTVHSTFFDTGGANWGNLYSKDNTLNYYFPIWKRIKIGTGENRQSDFIDFIDDRWVHTINWSHWYTLENKEKKIEDILQTFELNIIEGKNF